MTSVKISRISEFASKFRKYKIIVDGDNMGTIKDGKTVEIPVQPGEHELYLKIDWCRSNKITFNIADEEQVQFRCRYNGTCRRGNMMDSFKFGHVVIFKRDEFLLLEKLNDSIEV